MTGTMDNGTSSAQMTGNVPTRTNRGSNQSKGGNYENPGGNSTGTMGTPMNADMTSGQPDNSELSRFMNNGGGPEPHQGGNPGAQSDPGPKEIGFYDQARNHVLGDDGIQATVERPSPMRMGGISGSQPNPGQRGGQNTGTSGAQTTTNYSSPEEYGAGGIPGVTGTLGGDTFAGEQYSGGIGKSSSAGNGQTGARAAGNGGSGAMGAETRNPVGFAAGMTSEPSATHVPGHTGQAGGSGAQGDDPQAMHDSRPLHEPGHSAYVDELGAEGYGHTYQSRAAQKLVDMRKDSPTTYQRMDEPAEDKASRAADKAGEVADAVKDKAGGFFSGAKDKFEDFLNVDLDSDGSVGERPEHDTASSRSGASRGMGRARDTPGTLPYDAGERSGVADGNRGVSPQAFEIEETTPRDMAGDGGVRAGAGASPSATGTDSQGDDAPRNRNMPDMADRSVMQADGVSRTEAQQRELVDA